MTDSPVSPEPRPLLLSTWLTSCLCGSLQDTALDLLLDLPGPITVFAPISSAFDLMAEGHLTFLRSAEVSPQLLSGPAPGSPHLRLQGHPKLVELLRNHVVSSTAVSSRFQHLLTQTPTKILTLTQNLTWTQTLPRPRPLPRP